MLGYLPFVDDENDRFKPSAERPTAAACIDARSS